MNFINELKTKYMICFVDHNRLQDKETGKGILTATFQNSATYDTKLEALDHAPKVTTDFKTPEDLSYQTCPS